MMGLVVWCQPVGLMQVAGGSGGNETLRFRRDAEARRTGLYEGYVNCRAFLTLSSRAEESDGFWQEESCGHQR